MQFPENSELVLIFGAFGMFFFIQGVWSIVSSRRKKKNYKTNSSDNNSDGEHYLLWDLYSTAIGFMALVASVLTLIDIFT